MSWNFLYILKTGRVCTTICLQYNRLHIVDCSQLHYDDEMLSNAMALLLSVVERYDPRLNRWMSVAPMGTRRKHLGVAIFLNMIYAVGGRDDATELSSAERYNPQTNTWQPVVAMTSRRSGVSHYFHFDT